MPQKTRVLAAVGIVIVIVAVVLGTDALRRRAAPVAAEGGEPRLSAGSIPIYLNGRLMGGYQPADLERLEEFAFVDEEEGKTQQGWLLRAVLLLYVDEGTLAPDTVVTVSSSSRDRAAEVTWAEVSHQANWVMFDLAGRGTLKLVSVLERLDTRAEWVQDVDKVEVETN